MIENKTLLTKQMYKNASKRTLMPSIILFAVITVGTLLIAVNSLLELNLISAGVATIAFVMFLSITVTLMKSIDKQFDTTPMFAGQPWYNYSFDQEYIKIQFASDTMKCSEIAKWELLVKVIEYKDLFLIFIQNNQMYLIDKASFVQGSPEALAALIKQMRPTMPYKATKK